MTRLRRGPSNLAPAPIQSTEWIGSFRILIHAVNPVFLHLIRTPPEERDPAAIDQGRRHSIAVTRILNDHLAKRPYVGGAALTVGDISVGTVVHRWLSLAVERPTMPHLERYYALLAEWPRYRTHVMPPLA